MNHTKKIKRVIWATEEIELLKQLWCTDISNVELISRFVDKTFSDLRTKASRSLKLPARKNFTRSLAETWTKEETEILVSMWPTNIENSAIRQAIPNKTDKAIISKAGRMSLPKRPHEVRRNITVKRNKAMGRDLSIDNLTNIANKYKNKSQFRKEDLSAYRSSQILGIFDDICSHMVDGLTFNYPQTALFEIVKILFPTKTIRYNDRTMIHPKELDVYVVEDNIAFEYDGKNFHSSDEDTMNDANKDRICISVGIRLYRILEGNKNDPIPTIINQLWQYGFDVSKIDIDNIKSQITKYYMGIDDIDNIISGYSTLSDFISEQASIYRFLKMNNMSIMIEHLRIKEVTEEDIISAMENYTTKKGFRTEQISFYTRMNKFKTKFPLAYAKYNNLLDLNVMRDPTARSRASQITTLEIHMQ